MDREYPVDGENKDDSEMKRTASSRFKKFAHTLSSHPPADSGDMAHKEARISRQGITDRVVPANNEAILTALDGIAESALAQSDAPRRRQLTLLDRRASNASSAGAPGAGRWYRDTTDYERDRAEILRREAALAFDHRCKERATQEERHAAEIVDVVRHNDLRLVWKDEQPLTGHLGQRHPRHPGDHYLSNEDLVPKTELFKIAKKMPKGGHLHIHFNACLQPNVLLDIAKDMPRMFITSDLPLTKPDHFNTCEIQFSILPEERENPGNLFDEGYHSRQTMRFQEFLANFPKETVGMDGFKWLVEKLVFHADEAHGVHQTALGAWDKFGVRTRMMKGLFNYEKAYRSYTRLCLEHFIDDNIQYAEIRPNFMKTNQVYSNDGKRLFENEYIMEIIIDEYKKFKKEYESKRPDAYFAGLKVIYCTPRSFSRELLKHALDECIRFKKKWPQWIAGFDIMGEEIKGHPLKYFAAEFLEFRRQCDEEGLDIPFLFHCGETLETGSEADANLVDALLLNSRRIGHGFALARHPYIMEHMKKRNICLEVCPISNEILGLTPRMNGHAVYNLLANNVHCTVNSDNGTFFRYVVGP